ncbi:zinc-finger homeodomain protein 2-like [Cornus florida]|uniref:zinc-finger homeodomain protein 2-like n=1 Tax=Cornus florida TaxID=4283 RepID=UPI00289CA632|nr:zinc-finger homeodomain protein 2-like [Cornus florida]
MSLGGMKGMDLRMVPYGIDIKFENDTTHDNVSDTTTEPVLYRTRETPVEPVVMNPKPTAKFKYRHCMRNHAAAIGGHANDGCGEFMPSSADPLTCAACGCHRNFHRKEVQGGGHHCRSMLHSPPPPAMLAYNSGPTNKIGGFATMGPTSAHLNGGGLFGDVDLHDHDDHEVDRRSETPEREEVVLMGSAGPMSAAAAAAARNKRFRTKFTQQQKERMLEFAEKLGWRIQRQDDVALNQFCSEIGVKRNVLKVWMHNNKNAHRRRESAPTTPPAQPPPPPPAPLQPAGV